MVPLVRGPLRCFGVWRPSPEERIGVVLIEGEDPADGQDLRIVGEDLAD